MWTQMMSTKMDSRLKSSRFRRKFRLNLIDKKKYFQCGGAMIKEHAQAIVKDRLNNKGVDGHQTPYKGHPVFTAQHATGTCCRKCLFRWHRIPAYRDLNEGEVQTVVGIIMRWLYREISRR